MFYSINKDYNTVFHDSCTIIKVYKSLYETI